MRSASRSAGVRILEQVLLAVLENEQVGFRRSGDPDIVLVVVLNPAPDFFAIDQFDDDLGFVLGKFIDVFAFAVGDFGSRLPSFTTAGKLDIHSFHCLLSMGIIERSGTLVIVKIRP